MTMRCSWKLCIEGALVEDCINIGIICGCVDPVGLKGTVLVEPLRAKLCTQYYATPLIESVDYQMLVPNDNFKTVALAVPEVAA